jgi:anti-sigma B factor antagonist
MMPAVPARPDAGHMACIDVSLGEDLDLDTAPLMKSWIDIAVAANPGGTLRVDLGGIVVLDETGLGLLAGALLGMRETGGEVVLLNCGPEAIAVLTLTRLDRVFTIEG